MKKAIKTYNLPEKTTKQLKELKEIKGVSMSYIVELAIDDYYKKEVELAINVYKEEVV